LPTRNSGRGKPSGTVGWRELNALDGATAFDFYGQQFGWTKADAMDMGALGVYQMFAIGGAVKVSFELVSRASRAQELLVDLSVGFVKVRGATRAKVFKVARVSLPARGRVALAKTLSLAVHTTRVPRPGTHAVDALVNGARVALGAFEVVPV